MMVGRVRGRAEQRGRDEQGEGREGRGKKRRVETGRRGSREGKGTG